MTTTQPSSPTASGHAMDAFFGALRRSPLTRSDNRWVGGVCSGIAERIGIPPVVVRIATLVVGFFTPILAIYLIAVLLLPNRRGQIRLERALHGCGGSIMLLVITALLIFPGSLFDEHDAWFWAAGLGAAAGAYLVNRSRATQTLAQAAPVPPPYSAPYSAPQPSAQQHPYGTTAPSPQDAQH